MTTPDALLQSLRLPPAAQRDTRARAEGANGFGGSAPAQDKRGFEDLLADLAGEARGDGADPREPRAGGEPAPDATALLSVLKRGLIDAEDLANGDRGDGAQQVDSAKSTALAFTPQIDAAAFALRPAGAIPEGMPPADGENYVGHRLIPAPQDAVADKDASGEPRL